MFDSCSSGPRVTLIHDSYFLAPNQALSVCEVRGCESTSVSHIALLPLSRGMLTRSVGRSAHNVEREMVGVTLSVFRSFLPFLYEMSSSVLCNGGCIISKESQRDNGGGGCPRVTGHFASKGDGDGMTTAALPTHCGIPQGCSFSGQNFITTSSSSSTTTHLRSRT